jgi:bifunctional DNA-binding transcriptional regulator/antitoxin component of YhaV-PrlF toxin-antitoxin module
MGGILPVDAEIRERGQLTIPKSIRTSSHLDEGRRVRVIPLGASVLIAPYRPEIEEARGEIRRILEDSGLTAGQILKELAAERDRIFEESYARKKRTRLP